MTLTLKRLQEIMDMKLLTWRQNPIDVPNSFLAEYDTPYGQVKFEVIQEEENDCDIQCGHGAPLWSYAYILPHDGENAFFNHYFQYGSREQAQHEAELAALNIHNGDE